MLQLFCGGGGDGGSMGGGGGVVGFSLVLRECVWGEDDGQVHVAKGKCL